MPDVFDLLRWQRDRRPSPDDQARMRRLAEQTYAALVADPRWQPYVTWVTEQRELAALRREACLTELRTEFLAPQPYGRVKVALALATARVQAMDDVLQYVVTMVKETGDAAREGTNGPTG